MPGWAAHPSGTAGCRRRDRARSHVRGGHLPGSRCVGYTMAYQDIDPAYFPGERTDDGAASAVQPSFAPYCVCLWCGWDRPKIGWDDLCRVNRRTGRIRQSGYGWRDSDTTCCRDKAYPRFEQGSICTRLDRAASRFGRWAATHWAKPERARIMDCRGVLSRWDFTGATHRSYFGRTHSETLNTIWPGSTSI